MKTKLLAILFAILPMWTFAIESTSPNPQPALQKITLQAAANTPDIITFSEFPIGTSISNQYQDRGIIFGGSAPFITTDGANPSSPVLSGTPLFQGEITGTFVEPGTDRPTVVQSFTLDAGYFDDFGSTCIEWYDPKGNLLGQRINSHLGIERFTIEGGNIASWRINIVQNEPAGYAIDNISFVPLGPSILFREKDDDFKEGTWGLQKDEIPGFDHTAFQMGNKVYESHPGYPSGIYVSADGKESVAVIGIDGVQSQFTRNTFKYDSMIPNLTNVVDLEEIPVDETLAGKMRDAIESVGGWTYQRINNASFDKLVETLSPASQKGGNGAFTCVGLVEWSAEQAGQNGGEGFIRNIFESFKANDPRSQSNPPATLEIPLLSPQLLDYAMKGQQLLNDATQWLQGLFDPVDFMITDPLGRRLGFVQGTGLLKEIPHAFYSGNGGVEQFLIPNAIPGTYTIELVGVEANMSMAVGASGAADSFMGFLANGEKRVRQITIQPKVGSGGDVDRDGDVDTDDIQALIPRLNRFTDGLGDPGDLDGDGLLSETDLNLLTNLVQILQVVQVNIDIMPGSDKNPINPKAQGVVPVAILGSATFNVNTIDLSTLRFGPNNAPPVHSQIGHLEDINNDGIIDMIVHFPTKETGIVPGVVEACLTAKTTSGQTIKGCDQVCVLGQ